MEITVSRDGLSTKQLAFLNSTEDRVLFGGARGGGKSHVTRIGCAEDALTKPGRNILFIRPTIQSAKEQFSTAHMSRIIPREVTDDESGLRFEVWRYNGSDAVFTFANGPDNNNPFDGGSRLVLGGYKNMVEAQERYQGLEYYSMWVDELTKSDYDATDYVIGSLRDPEYKPKFRACSNPGERGHKEVKAEFVTPWVKLKRKFPEKFPEDYNSKISWRTWKTDPITGKRLPVTFAYIPATLDDNPNEHVRENYLITLLSLAPHLQKMYREGSWDTYEGKYWDEIDTTRNYLTKEDLANLYIDFEWELKNMKTYLSMDWGFQDYTSILWHLETSKGIIITYNEMYVNKTLMEDVARQTEMENERLGVSPVGIYTPWDIYLNKGGTFTRPNGEVIGEELVDVWRSYSKVIDIKASQDRKLGWANMTKGLMNTIDVAIKIDGVKLKNPAKKWIILKFECPHLTSQIDSAQINPTNKEDIKGGREDHSIDAARMFWVAHIIDPRITEELSKPEEGTGQWIRWNMEKRQKAAAKKRQTQITSW